MEPLKHDAPVDLVADARRSILVALKNAGHATIPELAAALSVSVEAVRQQLAQMYREGWIRADCAPDEENDNRTPGRPPAEYCLSPAAEDLFPKQYAELTRDLFDQLRDSDETLAVITDQRVKEFASAKSEQPLKKRMEALRSIYIADDPYTDVEESEYGYRLIERNCPYLQFALERPLFCSTTVSALRRLTNRQVVREARFQDRDGRCVFHVYADAPGSRRRFEREPPKNARPPAAKPK